MMEIEIIRRVCEWYNKNKRELPWREAADAYRVWISEIMLQQTRVEAVKPYYERFLSALPDVQSLVACPEDRLMKLWEGLGYYSRARNLQRTAQILIEERGGNLPSDPEELKKLPGIGDYTAGAIASFAFGKAVPAVDGNVLRVLARMKTDSREIDCTSVRKEYTAELTAAMQAFFREPEQTDSRSAASGRNASGELRSAGDTVPGDFNQGLMDLGATICLPSALPKCADCPLAKDCAAHAMGCETDFPARKQKRARRVEERTVLLVRDGERVALTKRPETGLLAGLYEFPCLPEDTSGDRAETEKHGGRKTGDASGERVAQKRISTYIEKSGLTALQIKRLPDARHIFSHVEWQMRAYEVRVAALDTPEQEEAGKRRSPSAAAGAKSDWILADIADIERNYPVPSAFSAYAEYLQLQIGAKATRDKHRGGK